MDSHGLPDDQPIFDQFSDLLTWDNIMYLVSNLGPGPQNTSHNPESKQDRPETLLTSLAQWSQNDTNTELLISLLLKNKKKKPFCSIFLDVLQDTQIVCIWECVIKTVQIWPSPSDPISPISYWSKTGLGYSFFFF